MWIFLHKNDARRILELDNQVGQLKNQVAALEDRWQTERIALSDIKEQVLNTLRRLEQRDTRARKAQQEHEDAIGATQSADPEVDHVTAKIRARRARSELPRQHAG